MEEIEQLTKFCEALAKVKSEKAQGAITEVLHRLMCKPFVVHELSESAKTAIVRGK
jgi:hypothetical protein